MISEVRAGAGRPEPILIVDSAHLPQVKEAVRVAEHEPDGDVTAAWGVTKRTVMLHVILDRPVQTEFWIRFSLPKHGATVQAALNARVVRILVGKPGDTVRSTMSEGGLRIEIPGADYMPHWPAPFLTAFMEHRREAGVSTMQARREADNAYRTFAETLDSIPRA